MQLTTILLLVSTGLVLAQETSLTRRSIGIEAPLTAVNSRAAQEIARTYTASMAVEAGLSSIDLESLYVDREYTDAHNGVTHIVYRQQFRGIEVYNAAWSVNINSSGQILSAGGELFGAPRVEPPSLQNAVPAVRAAIQAVNSRLADGFQPILNRSLVSRYGSIRFARGGLSEDIDGRMVWFGVRGSLQPAWVFYVTDEDGVTSYASVVDDATGVSLSRQPATHFQNSSAKGLVFEQRGPNPNPRPGILVTGPPPLVERTMQSFAGDSIASPLGWVRGTSTAGNNAVVGENPLGTNYLDPVTTKAKDGNFSFPLLLGPGAPPTTAFTDAVNTNLFYWINRAHDLHYLSGFTEAAGNFQVENFGRGGVGGDPIYGYSHFGFQALSQASLRNAFFTYKRHEDGSFPMVAMYLSYSGPAGYYTNSALDSDVVIHEYTHGVSLRLLPNGYRVFQEGAMGEAWSDFFGLEYTLPEGAPVDGAYPRAEYYTGTWGKGNRSRPYSTDMTVNSLTFADLGSVISRPEVHADGEIWVEALWDLRANLIKQFGEKEGRRRVRILVLDGMKFMPPASTMIDARDAILLADRADYKGASQDQIWAAFAKRGMGATAYSFSGDSVHISPSYEVPSEKAKIVFLENEATVGETLLVLVSDKNNLAQSLNVQFTSSSGDVESLQLRRSGSVLIGSISSSSSIALKENGTLNLIPGDFASVYYVDFNTGAGAELVSATIPVRPSYFAVSLPAGFDTSGVETLLFNGQRLELPFPFRYFDKTYSAVFVNKNGLLSFSNTALSSCTDILSLRDIPAIAPFWMQVSVSGTAQPREGIYYSRPDRNSVRFRWAGEVITAFAAGPPLNFSTTLVDDGTILFNYGAGNAELGGAVSLSGCNGSITAFGVPTVGLSSGHGTYSLGSYVQNGWTNTTGFRFDPPFNFSSFPKLIVESPKNDDRIQDILTVSGIGYDTDAIFSRAYLLIDGIQNGSATQTLNRPDFCAQQNVRGCPRVGFSMNLLTANLAPGKHTLQMRAVNSRGAFLDSPEQPITFTVDPGKARLPFGKVELPLGGAEVSGTLTIRGYAAITNLRIAAVDTLIDGVTVGPTTYGIARTDICGTLTPGPVNCPNIGFQAAINTRTGIPPIQDGEHSLQIRVRDELGRLTILPDSTVVFTVKNGTVQFPQGAITSVKSGDKVSGTVQIAGHAYAPVGTIRQVLVVYDNQFADLARYGVASPAACELLSSVAACPNIGWVFDLDTRRLTNGNHLITVQITDSQGLTTVLPSVGQSVVNLIVQN